MGVKRRKVDSQRERRILIALIVSSRFLARAVDVLDLDLLGSEHYKVVAGWCFDYHREYGKAPDSHVEDFFHRWAEDNEDSGTVDAVKDFLDSLGEQYGREGEVNVPYLLDELRDFVAKRQLTRLKEDIEYSLVGGKVADAESAVAAYRRPEVGDGSGFDPMSDKEAWKRAFAAPLDPLFTFGGDAGRFFNPAMTRDALVAIQAPEKTGKTFWCTEFAMRALRYRRRVALFEVGDLSESQIMLRLGVRWSGRPLHPWQTKRPIMVPTAVQADEAEESGYTIEAQAKRVRQVVNYPSTQDGIRRFRRAFGLARKQSYIKVAVYPTKSVTVAQIGARLDQWASQGWVADVVIIDYADILAPEPSSLRGQTTRDQTGDTWAALRRLSQEKHALVIAPTQANASTYEHRGDKLQTMRNFTEDKRKLAHVTAMFALNQTPEEKEVQGMRLNWIVLREAPFNSTAPLVVGTCFPLGRALCCGRISPGFRTKSDNQDERS